MATRYWVGGSGSQSWANLNNWSATEGGAGGASVPITGDTVYVTRGYSTIDQGLDQSLVTLFALTIVFDGSIGTASTSFRVGLSNVGNHARISCTQDVYIVIDGDASYTIVSVKQRAGATCYLGGVNNYLILTGGSLVSTSTFNVLQVDNFGGTFVNSEGTFTSYSQYKGKSLFSVSASTPSMFIRDGSADTYGTVAPSHVRVNPTGIFTHNSSGTVSAVTLYASSCVAGGTSNFTVTNATLYGACSLFRNPLVNITYTNAPVQYGIP